MTDLIDASTIKSVIYGIRHCNTCVQGFHLNDHEGETLEILEAMLFFLEGNTNEVLVAENKELKRKLDQIKGEASYGR